MSKNTLPISQVVFKNRFMDETVYFTRDDMHELLLQEKKQIESLNKGE